MDTAHPRDPHFTTAATLGDLLAGALAPLMIDVRRPPAYDKSEEVIAGALRLPPEEVAAAVAHLPRERAVVTYCVHGHEVSQNAARTLRAAGLDATYLEGGIEGWRAAGLPTMPKVQARLVLAGTGHPGANGAPAQ
jgi:rhodanese-related sulfurtransferase